ncbi:hypothetical protein ACWEOE_34755 [Amycolatopsis sp. NPDC004368]
MDRETSRLDAVKSFGADGLVQPAGATAAVAEASGGLGAAVAIEAVGRRRRSSCTPGWCGRAGTSRTSACTAPRPRCTWSSCGSRTSPSRPDWSTRPAPRCWPRAGRNTSRFVIHRFGLDEMEEAYDVFAHPQDSNALKVALLRS